MSNSGTWDNPKVVNKRQALSRSALYVGRPTKWGNPFVIGRDGTRAEVIAKYEANLSPELRAMAREELRGWDLACWCAPLACHADVLLRIANEEDG